MFCKPLTVLVAVLAVVLLLAPLIGQLRLRHRLNALGIEALAAAVHLEATVFLSAPSSRLEQALRAEGLHVEVAA